ncbi:protein ULTRAPETALA 1-like [Cynara cardunculus var. scolymus]|uniref:protein ULTRAPETALA 1-like n=1 Tax=Cynara cardunculus var. scolymus TaxID=59895 RepID=UPI000D631165|nr:protein ULTRAPETALA 1-like [Cynara cardunculus var. scolymus]
MANGAEERGSLVMEDGSAMFSEEEVSEISGFKRGGDDHVEVTCGCTSHCYGDAVGTLRVFASGDLEISCDCTPGCQEDKLTPAAFEKHSGRETARKWKNNIWVIVDGEKVPLSKTALLKYYNQALRKTSNRSQTGRVCHRDEFLRCTQCNKLRRFRLRTKEECRAYHDAFINDHWKCSDMPYDKITCEEEEERASRRVYRGCLRSTTCKGCTSCVCFGCDTCRFSDCRCQTCIDFTRNTKP